MNPSAGLNHQIPSEKAQFSGLETLLRVFLAILILTGMHSGTQAQKSINDSTIGLTMVNLSWTGLIPDGDLGDRYGFSSLVGGELGYKLKSNFYFYTGAKLLFGGQLKEDVARNIVYPVGDSATGFVLMSLGIDGRYSAVRFFQRGFVVPFVAGKIFHVSKKSNPNAGIFAEVGFQYIQHKIRIEVVGNNVAQLDKDNRKGYDRLCSGIGLIQGFGYRHLGNNRLTNFFIGVELSQNFTKSRREINMDTGISDLAPRLDLYYALKVGWTFPIYGEAARKIYYY
jgi:hypothetical protein